MDLVHTGRGDGEGFEALFHSYKNLVYRTAYLMLGSAGDAEDALQEVFMQVHRALPTYDPTKGALTTWLHRITVNHCLNRKRRPCLTAVSLEAASRAPAAGFSPSPESRLEDEEMVQGALAKVSEKLRAVIILRYYLDLSYLEIAQVMRIPLGTVKSRLTLALRALRRELDTTSGKVSCQQPRCEGEALL